VICNIIVKNEILWEKHAKSAEHIIGLKLLKENMAKKKEEEKQKELIIKEDKVVECESVSEVTLKDYNIAFNEVKNDKNNVVIQSNVDEQAVNSTENPDKEVVRKNKLLKLLSEDKHEDVVPKVEYINM
jgi:hypothetical protein